MTLSCSRCGHPLVAINLTIDGRGRELRSCSYCELRVWNDGDEALPLESVLGELAEATSRARRA